MSVCTSCGCKTSESAGTLVKVNHNYRFSPSMGVHVGEDVWSGNAVAIVLLVAGGDPLEGTYTV